MSYLHSLLDHLQMMFALVTRFRRHCNCTVAGCAIAFFYLHKPLQAILKLLKRKEGFACEALLRLTIVGWHLQMTVILY